MNIGLLGGSFDPPHIGHLIFSIDAKEKLKLSEVLWIVTDTPSHKPRPRTAFNDRLNMSKIYSKDYSWIKIIDFEEKMPKPNYTINTINKLKQIYSKATNFFLMIGEDQANQLSTWKSIEKLKKEISFIVMKRTNIYKKEGISDFYLLDRKIDISSTEIRDRVKNKKLVSQFLKVEVEKYIINKKLYL